MSRTEEEEAKLENAFRQIGVLNLIEHPEELVRVCESHTQLRDEISRTLDEEQHTIRDLLQDIVRVSLQEEG